MAVSQKVARFVEEGGWIRRMFEAGIALKQQYGEDKVFDLSLGNPVVEPPHPGFTQELRRLAETPLAGDAPLYAQRRLCRDQGRRGSGSQGGDGHTIHHEGNRDDLRALRAGPQRGAEGQSSIRATRWCFFAPLLRGVRVLHRQSRGGSRSRPHRWQLPAGPGPLWRGWVTPRTKAVFINSPNNPSGAIYGADVLKDMGDLLRRKIAQYGTEIFLISDEPYRRIIYDGLTYPQVFPPL